MASGFFSTSRYLGSIIGTSLLAGPLAPLPGDHFGRAFAFIALAAAGSALASLALPGRVSA